MARWIELAAATLFSLSTFAASACDDFEDESALAAARQAVQVRAAQSLQQPNETAVSDLPRSETASLAAPVPNGSEQAATVRATGSPRR